MSNSRLPRRESVSTQEVRQSLMRPLNERFIKTWRIFWGHRLGRVGFVGLCILVLIAVFASWLAPYGQSELTADALAAPGAQHLLGTDHLGRDILSQLLYGSRISLMVGFTSAFISAFIGVIIGATAGYYGGWADELLSKVTDVALMMPVFFLILLVLTLFGSSLLYVMIIIGFTIWPSNARLMRAQALTLRERTFVKASRLLGESNLNILWRHIIPNGLQPVIANTTLQMAGAILTEASLSFIGLGDPNLSSWGRMIFEGRGYLTMGWWATLFPGFAIVITVLILYFVGDGLNYIMQPDRRSGGLS